MGEGQLTYNLPSSYTYASIEDEANSFNPPMMGRIENDGATLTHLASFFKISVTNIPGGSFPEDPSDYVPTGYGAVETDGRWNVVAAE